MGKSPGRPPQQAGLEHAEVGVGRQQARAEEVLRDDGAARVRRAARVRAQRPPARRLQGGLLVLHGAGLHMGACFAAGQALRKLCVLRRWQSEDRDRAGAVTAAAF